MNKKRSNDAVCSPNRGKHRSGNNHTLSTASPGQFLSSPLSMKGMSGSNNNQVDDGHDLPGAQRRCPGQSTSSCGMMLAPIYKLPGLMSTTTTTATMMTTTNTRRREGQGGGAGGGWLSSQQSKPSLRCPQWGMTTTAKITTGGGGGEKEVATMTNVDNNDNNDDDDAANNNDNNESHFWSNSPQKLMMQPKTRMMGSLWPKWKVSREGLKTCYCCNYKKMFDINTLRGFNCTQLQQAPQQKCNTLDTKITGCMFQDFLVIAPLY